MQGAVLRAAPSSQKAPAHHESRLAGHNKLRELRSVRARSTLRKHEPCSNTLHYVGHPGEKEERGGPDPPAAHGGKLRYHATLALQALPLALVARSRAVARHPA